MAFTRNPVVEILAGINLPAVGHVYHQPVAARLIDNVIPVRSGVGPPPARAARGIQRRQEQEKESESQAGGHNF